MSESGLNDKRAVACLKVSMRDYLLDFFLCIFFTFFLPPGVMLRGLSFTLLTRAGCVSPMPIASLRIFLGCHIRLVVTSQNDDFSCSCFLHVWTWSLNSHGHSSWVNAHHVHFPVMMSQEVGPAGGTQKGASSSVEPTWLWC